MGAKQIGRTANNEELADKAYTLTGAFVNWLFVYLFMYLFLVKMFTVNKYYIKRESEGERGKGRRK